MVREKKQAKSETLTIRLDAKTRFALEFVARLRGQPLTVAVERAIIAAAGPDAVEAKKSISWASVWDVSQAVRELRMADIPELFPTYEEERRLAFAIIHWPFFYSDERRAHILNFYVDTLWPKIDELTELHEASKEVDFFSAAKEMAKMLKDAGIEPPDFPAKGDTKLKHAVLDKDEKGGRKPTR